MGHVFFLCSSLLWMRITCTPFCSICLSLGEVKHRHFETCLFCVFLQLDLPQLDPWIIGSAAVCRYKQFSGTRVSLLSQHSLMNSTANSAISWPMPTLTYPSLSFVYRKRLLFLPPAAWNRTRRPHSVPMLLSIVLEVAYDHPLLCIDGNDRLVLLHEFHCHRVDTLKLQVAICISLSLVLLPVVLEVAIDLMQDFLRQYMTDLVFLHPEFSG